MTALSPSFYIRYKELILLVTGFLLTGIIGTYITSVFQANQYKINRNEELVKAKSIALSKEKDKQFSFTVFDEHYHAIGYLSYQMANTMTRKIQQGKIGVFAPIPVKQLAPTYAFPR